MDIKIHSLRFDADEKLQSFIETKVNKLGQYYDHILAAEITLRLDKSTTLENKVADIIIYGPEDIIKAAADKFCPGLNCEIRKTGDIKFKDISVGKNSAECGVAAHNAVISAVNDALTGKIDAVVTAPISKTAVNLAGIEFTGHTELIAELCGTAKFAMMQSAGNLRVIFVTTHISVSRIASSISEERIIDVTLLLQKAVKEEGVEHPRLAVAGLNPHAGEDGYMGDEDEKIVKPAIEKLIKQYKIMVEGPFPSDTLFVKSEREKFDGIVSMYHDQGHIPFKMLAFDCGVNSTLGLPVIRTSVCHGTAFNIAWQGVANINSLIEAIRLAALRASSRLY